MLWVSGRYIKKNWRAAGLTKLATTPACWPSGLAVTICDGRAAGRRHRRFKSGCTPIFLHVFSTDPQRPLLLLIYILVSTYRRCGLKGTVWDGDLATVLYWRGLSTTGL